MCVERQSSDSATSRLRAHYTSRRPLLQKLYSSSPVFPHISLEHGTHTQQEASSSRARSRRSPARCETLRLEHRRSRPCTCISYSHTKLETNFWHRQTLFQLEFQEEVITRILRNGARQSTQPAPVRLNACPPVPHDDPHSPPPRAKNIRCPDRVSEREMKKAMRKMERDEEKRVIDAQRWIDRYGESITHPSCWLQHTTSILPMT